MTGHYEMRFSGSGGQGLMLVGDVMAQSAGIAGGKEIVLTKSYGPESRGGACRSELIIDDGEISCPVVSAPDFVLAMSELACAKYVSDMRADGVLLIDSGLVKNVPGGKRVYGVALTEIAQRATGRAIAANVTALGAISVLTDAAAREDILAALLAKFPENARDANRRSFMAGVDAAERLL